MTKKQLEARVRRWQKVLRLADWKIDVEAVPADKIRDNVFADITTNYAKLYGELRCSVKREDVAVNRSACHEITHVLLAELWDVFWEVTEKVGLELRNVSRQAFKDGEHRVIERLVDALCEDNEGK